MKRTKSVSRAHMLSRVSTYFIVAITISQGLPGRPVRVGLTHS